MGLFDGRKIDALERIADSLERFVTVVERQVLLVEESIAISEETLSVLQKVHGIEPKVLIRGRPLSDTDRAGLIIECRPSTAPEFPEKLRLRDSEFISFDEAMQALNIDEDRLKRLVSEGEIRIFREGDQMKFKRREIAALAGR